MPKGPALTKAEREEIVTLRASNLSARDIAKRIDRSKTVVLNYLKNPTTYGTTKRSGRKRALTKAQEEQIFRALSSGRLTTDDGAEGRTEDGAEGRTGGAGSATDESVCKLSAEQIRKEFALPLSTRRVQQLLSDWRRSARKALDQQHALPTEDNAQESVVAEDEEKAARRDNSGSSGSVAPPPPPSPPSTSVQSVDDDDDEGSSLLAAIAAPQPLVLEGDMDETTTATQPTEEVLV